MTELKTAEATTEGSEQALSSPLLLSAVKLAVASIPGAVHAGLSVRSEDHRLVSAAVTDELILRCDDAERELGQGPCADKAWDGLPLVIADTATDDRWPAYSRRLAANGVASALVTRVNHGRRTVAALTLYAEKPDAFDAGDVALASALADHASVALASDQLEQHLRIAVETRQLIGQAVGILMERHKLDADSAFELLVRASQRGSVKLRDIAARVVKAGPDSLGERDPDRT